MVALLWAARARLARTSSLATEFDVRVCQRIVRPADRPQPERLCYCIASFFAAPLRHPRTIVVLLALPCLASNLARHLAGGIDLLPHRSWIPPCHRCHDAAAATWPPLSAAEAALLEASQREAVERRKLYRSVPDLDAPGLIE